MAASSRARTLSYSIPTETAPTIAPPESRSGTLPRAERPSVPLSISMTSSPASASLGSVETTLPICLPSVCDQRTPRRSMTTTYSAPVALRTRSASRCTGPSAAGRDATRSAASCGWAAVDSAMARARRIAWSSSWWLSGARNRPVASTVTPAAMASCISSTWEKTRCGQPNRRRPGAGVLGTALMPMHGRRLRGAFEICSHRGRRGTPGHLGPVQPLERRREAAARHRCPAAGVNSLSAPYAPLFVPYPFLTPRGCPPWHARACRG